MAETWRLHAWYTAPGYKLWETSRTCSETGGPYEQLGSMRGSSSTLSYDTEHTCYVIVLTKEVAGKRQKATIIPKPKGRTETQRREHAGSKKAAHLGSTHAHPVEAMNLGGSLEALVNAMETDARVLLIQEHRVAGPGLPGIQGIPMGKGWHGVWDAATAKGNGRSGGTAALVRRPVPTIGGGRMDRGERAVVSWTRRSRMQVASVYNACEGDPNMNKPLANCLGNGKSISRR